jgi:eukaryotic-like serine/threonine-protein kinase
MTAEIGQIIDAKYKLVRLLGTGGMGAVYEGENLRIRRRVAIKMLHGNVSSQAESVTRFEREAQAAGRIGSDHICEVLDLGVLHDGTRYMVMEYLDGETLSGRIKRLGRLTPMQSIPLIVQVLEGLAAAHAAGIVHRDLKPDNVWVVPQKSNQRDFVKILDFGVSKFSQIGGEEMNMTRAGAVVGTPYYMSPEQARGMAAVDARTDIYAMGVLLYQATTGQVPYQAETFNELLFKIVLEVAPPPQTYVPDLDSEFAGIIIKAMAREPTQRYQSCQEFRDALLAYQAARAAGATGAHRPILTGNGGTQMIDMSGVIPQPMPHAPPAAAWGNASSSGAGPAVGPMGSGSQWVVGPMGPQPMATANSWGTSQAPPMPAARPKSNAGLVFGLVGGLLLIGGGATAFLVFGKPSATPATDTRTPAAPASASPAAPPGPSAAPSPSTPETSTASTASSSAPSASAAAAPPASAPSAAPAADSAQPSEPSIATPQRPQAPAGRPRPAQAPKAATTAKPTAKPAVPAAGDLGY